MSIRIRKLDDGYLVTDDRGARVWEGAAVSFADAEVMAESRLNPRLPAPPPGHNGATDHGGYAEARPEPCGVVDARNGQEPTRSGQVLAQAQFDQATGDAPCVGGVCTMD